MKKIIAISIALIILSSLAACGSAGTSATEASPAPSADASSQSAAETTRETAPSSEGVDVDLSAMSGTMVYSEVLNMQQHPEDYMGKTVKMQGPFNVTEIEDNRYFACIIADATACCSTGIEFDWAGEHSYPADYPEVNSEITVVGTFTTYMEGTSRYLRLKDAEVDF